MTNVPEIFADNVFDEHSMEACLPREIWESLRKVMQGERTLTRDEANVVAGAMKEWAVSKGATHFTHWFQPMTGITAEKHDSFIAQRGSGVMMDFSGKELIQGEPDASSFPSGGLRMTFEARGYTAWDATSYAFIKANTLCIPTVFCAYGGQALDQKTALLRSGAALDKAAVRVLRLFGNKKTHHVHTTVGPEQEYFLIDRKYYEQRPDLIYTGRTLTGARPAKGQELDDHYFGTIPTRVKEFMADLDEELWKLGVLAKTEHNEVAPAQHELAPIFTLANIAADHNQLTMEIMQRVAQKHDMVCLLHEKPFDGVNGSGKHNNWSMATDDGMNLLEPGDTPAENAQFLLFLCAVICAVDEYQDLLRISVASAGNDHRLGAHAAPPAIISIFVGDELWDVLESIENGWRLDARQHKALRIGVDTLPPLPQDTTDRNRTSPFAFTGNKFEFRMPGSSASISCTNAVLNTAVADVLTNFADQLEGADNFVEALHDLLQTTIRDHNCILFNGDGYDESWVEEAHRRGLSDLRTTPEAVSHFLDQKNVDLYARQHVYTLEELNARYAVKFENYRKTIRIEALTLLDMVRRDILPAVTSFAATLASDAAALAPYTAKSNDYASDAACALTALIGEAHAAAEALSSDLETLDAITDDVSGADYCANTLLPAMSALRTPVDAMELRCPSAVWPYPSYGEMLFSVK